MNESRTYISMSDAAAIAHVTKETIRNLCKRGAIGYETHGNFFYPCKEDVERYAASIATIHASEQKLERYKLELQEQMEQLRLAKTDAQALLDAETPDWRKGNLVEGGNEGCRRLSEVMREAYRLTEGEEP